MMPDRRPTLEKIAPRRLRPPLTRSEVMGRIRSKDTRPEVKTRSAVHARGKRFRVHVADLPETVDRAVRQETPNPPLRGCFLRRLFTWPIRYPFA